MGQAETPNPGSRLDADDKRHPALRPSTVAWTSIGSAVDHIGLASDALQRKGGVILRPSAFYTVCRGALVAASQAVWVMTGTQTERLRRVRLLEWEETKARRDFFRDYERDPTFESDTSTETAKGVREMLAEFDAHERALRSSLKPKHGEGSVTATLRNAADVASSHTDDEWVRRAFLFEWRSASADSHARLWQRLVRPGHQVPLIGQGKSIQYVTGTLQSYGQSLAVATIATSEAFRLWDEQCGRIVTEPDISETYPG